LVLLVTNKKCLHDNRGKVWVPVLKQRNHFQNNTWNENSHMSPSICKTFLIIWRNSSLLLWFQKQVWLNLTGMFSASIFFFFNSLWHYFLILLFKIFIKVIKGGWGMWLNYWPERGGKGLMNSYPISDVVHWFSLMYKIPLWI